MRKWILLLVAMLFLIAVLPVTAQDVNCDIDLSPTSALLVRAQAAASAGDSDRAVALMAEARTQLQRFEAVCSERTGGMGDGTDAFPLGNTYTIDSRNGALTFNYPDGWRQGDIEDESIVLGSNASALDKDFNQPDPPPFAPDEQVMFVTLTDARSFGVGDLGDSPDTVDFLEGILADMPETMHQTGELTRFTINDHPVAQANLATENVEIAFLLVDLGVGRSDDKQFGAIIAITAMDKLTEFEPTLHAVAKSFDFE